MPNELISHTAEKLLNLRHLPARLNSDQAAAVLGFQPHDIPILVRGKLLKPLGNPAQNGTKYFAASAVCERRDDRDWLGKATAYLSRHWHDCNQRKAKWVE